MSASVSIDLLAKDRASGTIAGVGRSADKTGSKFRSLAKVGKVAALGLAAGLGVASVAAFKLVKGAAEDQAAATRLATTLRRTTGATTAQVAATESWISKQGLAKGVTDDELRPALAKLATGTHDLGKAQQLAGLAMDVSAGSGKSLASVSQALMKAQTGSVSGLAKFGISTKDAAGKTVSLEVAQRRLAATFKGQASKAADTTQGKFNRLKVALSEAGESIGYALLPPLTAMATWLVSKGLPALSKFGGAFQAQVTPKLSQAGQLIGSQLLPRLTQLAPVLMGAARSAMSFGQFLARNSSVILPIVAGVVAMVAAFKIYSTTLGVVRGVTTAYTAVQAALNVVMAANPVGLLVLALVGLGVGLVVAYKKSETFRNVVNKVGSSLMGVVKFAGSVLSWVKGHWPLLLGVLTGPFGLAVVLIVKHWGRIKSAVSGGVSAAIGFVKSHWLAIVTLLTGPFGLAVGLIAKHWGQIKSAVSNGVSTVVSTVKGLPGRITGALGNLGSLLYNAGSQVIQGLLNGIESKVGSLKDKLGAVTKIIPDWKGPLDKDKVLLTPAGVAIMDGLISGITSKEVALKTVLAKVTAHVKATGEKLKGLLSAKADFAAGFQSFGSSVFSTDLSTQNEDGTTSAPTVQSVLDAGRAQRDQANQVQADVKRLVGLGLSKSLIQQLQASGSSGIAQIHALAGGSQADIAEANALDKQTSDAYAGAGSAAGGALYDAKIKDARSEDRLAQKIAKAIREEDAKKDHQLTFTIHGNDLIAIQRKIERDKGRK